MEIIAKLFEKDGQNVWTSKSGEVFSVCVESNVSSLDLTTGFVRDEKLMFWVKANSEESAVKNAETIIKNINSGKLAPYRAFSETPFSSADTKDINPTTGVELDRYSQVRLCPIAKFEELHRQYVVNPVATTTDQVTA